MTVTRRDLLKGAALAGAAAALPGGLARPAAAQTTQKRELVVAQGGDIASLDPHMSTSSNDIRISFNVFDNLTSRRPDGKLVAGLATEWKIQGQQAWAFKLRQGVKWHNGDPFTSADVKYSIERTYDSAAKTRVSTVLTTIEKIEAPDPSTVVIHTKKPDPLLPARLGFYAGQIVPKKYLESVGPEVFNQKPIGTGPVRFVSWTKDDRVVLEANPDYWGVKPKIKRVVVRNIKDNSQRLGALKAGEIHGMEGLNPDDVAVVRRDPNLQVLLRPTNTTGYIAFNYKVKEFQDKRVRQAFAYAINRGAIVDALYGGTGMAATQFQPPPLWGYNKDLKGYEYSPAKAQDLLKEAGLSGGLSTITWDDGKKEPLVFWYMSRSRPYFPNPKEIAEAMAADLAKVGIKTQLQTTEWAVYLDKRKNGQMPLYMLGWTGDNGDPDNFLCYFFCGPGAAREGFYANKPLADVLLRAQKLTQQSERAKLYREAEQLLRDDAGRLFIANNRPPLAFAKRVKGYVPHPTGSEYFNTVELQ
jgi:peptide/nickel transport system substrate-binding protein